jgi:ParG protein
VAKKVQIAPPREVTTQDEWVSRKPKPEAPTEPMKRLTVDIPESLHTRIKLACVANRQKMADAVRAILEQNWPEAA